MARFRHIPTRIKSIGGLAKALEELGLREIEVHEAPQPLLDWIGRPTDELANIIVRRKSLGASGDDLGFARNTDGTFDLVLSDIHLFRFNKAWVEELTKRHDARAGVPDPTPAPIGTSAQHAVQESGPLAAPRPLLTPKSAPTVARVEVDRPWSPLGSHAEAAIPRALEAKAARPPVEDSRRAPNSGEARIVAKAGAARSEPKPGGEFDSGHDARVLEHAGHDARAILEDFRKSQTLASRGCLFFALPVPLYVVATLMRTGSLHVQTLLALIFVCGFLSIAVITSSVKRGLEKAARDFEVRFPQGTRQRTAALGALEALAKSRHTGTAPNPAAVRLLDALRGSTERPRSN